MALSGLATTWPTTLPPQGVVFCYTTFILASAVVSYGVAEMSISVLLTLGGMSQCLAVSLLWVGSFSQTGVHGVSAQSLILYMLSLSLRLSSSTWLNGYLPVDASGDGLYQTVDAITLVASALLLGRVARAHHRAAASEWPAFQIKLKSLLVGVMRNPLVWGVPVTFGLASMVHADMNARPFYDTLWTAGHFFSAAASMPQLRLSSQNQSAGGAYVQYSLMAAALSQLFVLVYMWLCRQDVSCKHWIEGVSHAIWFILAAPLAHLAIICDVVPLIFSTEIF